VKVNFNYLPGPPLQQLGFKTGNFIMTQVSIQFAFEAPGPGLVWLPVEVQVMLLVHPHLPIMQLCVLMELQVN